MTLRTACMHAQQMLDRGLVVQVHASPERKPVDVRMAGELEVAHVVVRLDVPGREVTGADLRSVMDYCDENDLRFRFHGAEIVLTGP